MQSHETNIEEKSDNIKLLQNMLKKINRNKRTWRLKASEEMSDLTYRSRVSLWSNGVLTFKSYSIGHSPERKKLSE